MSSPIEPKQPGGPIFHCSTIYDECATWHLKIPMFNRKYIFKWWIFHCHVSFRRMQNCCFENINESWLVYRDPYFMAYEIIPSSPIPPKQPGALFSWLNWSFSKSQVAEVTSSLRILSTTLSATLAMLSWRMGYRILSPWRNPWDSCLDVPGS